MTVASRVLMAAFGRIPEKFFFLGIGILCLTGYLIAGISISKALFDKEMKILSWIVTGVLFSCFCLWEINILYGGWLWLSIVLCF